MSEVTTIIATLDEELHIRRSVESTRVLGPVFVVDAGSVDSTVDLARAAGAVVVEHPWAGYSAQKNWALDNLPVETEWVLFIDADEYVTPELAEEIRAVISTQEADGFYLPETNVFMGRPLEHVWDAAYALRLFRRERGRFEDRVVHESAIVDGRLGRLEHMLFHENLKGIDAFVERHLRYAALEAEEMERAAREGWGRQRRGRLLGNWSERRRFLKVRVWYRVPFRPAIRFIWLYVVRRGFLDGRPGLLYSSLIAMYEIMINAKRVELRQASSAPESAPGDGARRGEGSLDPDAA